ncbi:MAG: type I-E CRISPR-associated protein Cse2/CasB [Pseudonocardia sp.]
MTALLDAETGATGDDQPRLLGVTGTFVDATIADIQSRFLRDRQDPAAVTALARLRRAAGKQPGAVLDVLQYTYSPTLARGTDDDAPTTPAEQAAHLAITLYAVHQQSRGERMHVRRRGLGTALRGLAAGPEKDLPDPIVRRFRMLGTADSFPELSHHLRGVVQLLRAGGAPLDYGRLADQLVAWQTTGRDRVRMTWGRQFYRQNRTAAATDTPNTPDPDDSRESS